MSTILRYPGLLLVLSLAILGPLVAFSTPVFAIADPAVPPQITNVYVYQDLIEDSDAGVLIDYNLDYDPAPGIPTEPVTESYLAAFVDTDGTTQLKAVAPYTFTDNGYERGLVWIYFSAAEASAASIDRVNEALYRVWLMGNPTVASGWTGDPPKTISGIDYWMPDGASAATLLAQIVLGYADTLELLWSPLDMIQNTALGNRLASPSGETYFENVILGLREMAPSAFAATTVDPTVEDLDYTTGFGAVLTNGPAPGGGTAAGSPITLAEGANDVNVTGLGTFTVELEQGTAGTAASDVCTVTGGPAALVAGTNTITTVGVIGNIVVTVNLSDTTSAAEDTISGTGFDLTLAATRFGMSRWMFSGIIWLILSVVICAAAYTATGGMRGGGGKSLIAIFNLCIVAGVLLGLLTPLVAVLMFVLWGLYTGYVLFFRGASI